jgi:hypothetical protein
MQLRPNMTNDFIYSLSQMHCNECQAKHLTIHNNDGTPWLHCIACNHSEIIPKFKTDAQEYQFILNHIEINLI